MKLEKNTIISIIRGVEPSNVCDVQEALIAGGITAVEVSLSNEEKGLQCIKALAEKFGDRIDLGVGTITSKEQAEKAIELGAKYLITPGWDRELIRELQTLDIPIFPGVLTPGEILQAINEGINTVKLFPSDSLGTSYIKNVIKGPFPEVDFMAVGGVTLENITEYQQAGCSSFGIGSDLVPRGATIQDFDRIKNRAEQYVSTLAKGSD